jgi:hypothetical protein
VSQHDAKIRAASRLVRSSVDSPEYLPSATRMRLADLALELEFIADALELIIDEGGDHAAAE